MRHFMAKVQTPTKCSQHATRLSNATCGRIAGCKLNSCPLPLKLATYIQAGNPLLLEPSTTVQRATHPTLSSPLSRPHWRSESSMTVQRATHPTLSSPLSSPHWRSESSTTVQRAIRPTLSSPLSSPHWRSSPHSPGTSS